MKRWNSVAQLSSLLSPELELRIKKAEIMFFNGIEGDSERKERCSLYTVIRIIQEAIEALSNWPDNNKLVQVYIGKIKEIAILSNKKQEDNVLLKGNCITRK